MKIQFAFLLITSLFFTFNATSGEHIRLFKAVDSPTKLTLLDLDQKTALMKLENHVHDDNGKVFMVNKEKDRFMPVEGATSLALIDYNKKTLISGTIKKVWSLVGVGRDYMSMEEVDASGIDAKMLKAQYETQEGAGSYGKDIALMNKHAEGLIQEKCKIKMTVQIQKNSFDQTGYPSSYKSIGAVQGLIHLCSDNDYLAALKQSKTLVISGTTGSTKTEKNGATLSVVLAKDIHNTANVIKKSLEKSL